MSVVQQSEKSLVVLLIYLVRTVVECFLLELPQVRDMPVRLTAELAVGVDVRV